MLGVLLFLKQDPLTQVELVKPPFRRLGLSPMSTNSTLATKVADEIGAWAAAGVVR